MISSGLTWGSSSTSLLMISSGLTWGSSSTSFLLISWSFDLAWNPEPRTPHQRHHFYNTISSTVMQCQTPHYQHQCKLSHAMPNTTLSTSVQVQSCNAKHHTINIVQAQSCNAKHHTINISASSVMQRHTHHTINISASSVMQCHTHHTINISASSVMQCHTHHTIDVSASSVMQCHTHHTINISAGSVSAAISKSKTPS